MKRNAPETELTDDDRVELRPESELEPDPIGDWMDTHPDEVAKYSGKRIAVHSTRGIVASGDTYESIRVRVNALGIAGHVVYCKVPAM